MKKKGRGTLNTRYENLCAILADLKARGVRWKEAGGTLKFRDALGVLSEGEKAGLELCRAGLTEAYRRQRGLCIACGLDTAKHPDLSGRRRIRDIVTGEMVWMDAGPMEELRARYPPLWCRLCWEAGRWKDGQPLSKEDRCDAKE